MENYFIFEQVQKKKFEPAGKEVIYFLPKKVSLSSQKYVLGIQDSR
jgi:hypothetical protein